MSFTWPDIPFQGTEVTAFVTAYKELAEAILDDYFHSPIGHQADMVLPYKEKLVVKELLQEGLLYASFIIQQRSGVSGPGTDFVLGNSPFDLSDPTLAPELLRLLGCKWDEMEESLQNNMKCGKQPPPEPEVEDNVCCEQGMTAGEGLTVAWIERAMMWNPWRNMLTKLLTKYLNCETSVFTQNDLSSGELDAIKADLQKMINNRDTYWRDIGWDRTTTRKVTDVTNQYTASQLSYWGASKVYQLSLYKNDLLPLSGGHYVVGYTRVTTDANNNVLCLKDDYDFEYGWIMDRSDGSLPGDPYTNRVRGSKTLDSQGNARTRQQVRQEYGDPGRALPINAFFSCNGGGHNGGGRGTPVPISICF